MEDIIWDDENGMQWGSGKRKARRGKFEFIGWGSKQLIKFLEAIGKDTSSEISRYDVADIINRYAIENKLQHPQKKKRIICDEKLLSVFGRRMISRIKIYDLLDSHYAESNYGFSSSSDDEQRPSPSERTTIHKKKVKCVPKSCWAAIISENIRLLYLKGSLVQELVKQPDTFESKVVGSFVRIKSDPNDYLQKNSHQLVQVTGVKKVSKSEDVLLHVSNCINDICISMLSDDDFSKEECEDLHNRIKNGMLKRPTVVEFEEKARALHEDVMKHWLSRELVSLQGKMDRANEKGWRKELVEYLERMELLQKPEEQSRLLHEVPEVIAEEVELADQEISESQELCGSLPVSTPQEVPTNSNIAQIGVLTNRINKDSPDDNCYSTDTSGRNKDYKIPFNAESTEKIEPPTERLETELNHDVRESNPGWNIEPNNSFRSSQKREVIVLSDDEEDEKDGNNQTHHNSAHDIRRLMWHYRDPQGVTQGPFSLSALKRWSDAGYFQPDFKVWRAGQSHDQAQLLTDLLRRVFPS